MCKKFRQDEVLWFYVLFPFAMEIVHVFQGKKGKKTEKKNASQTMQALKD